MAPHPDYGKAAEQAALRHGVDPAIFRAQIQAESNFNPNARSPAGARGIAQFEPATAKAYGVNLNDGRAADDLNGAARLMRKALDQNGGDYRKALSVYNSGRADGYKRFAETKAYVERILGRAGGASTSSTPGSVVPGRAPSLTPGSTKTNYTAALTDAMLNNRTSKGLLQSALALADTGQYTTSTPATLDKGTSTRYVPGSTASSPTSGGLASFDGKQVASWIKPLLEYARARGWKGTVTSGYRSDAQQKAIYDRGTRPAAKPRSEGGAGSNHSRSGFLQGAVDVTDPQTLSKILAAKHSRLKAAGAKDPPHFSVPRGGRY